MLRKDQFSENNNNIKITIIPADDLDLKIAVFEAIYQTLQICQNNILLFKTNFLLGKENLTSLELAQQLESYRKQYPTSRTAKAFELMEKHYQHCNIENVDLINEMYQYVCKNKTHFGTTFFSQFTNPAPLTKEQIKNTSYYQDKQLANIQHWLNINMFEYQSLGKGRKKNSNLSIS